MSQVEVPKIHSTAALGPPTDHVSVTKIHATVLLVPGDGSDLDPSRQGHVLAQIVRKRV